MNRYLVSVRYRTPHGWNSWSAIRVLPANLDRREALALSAFRRARPLATVVLSVTITAPAA